MRGGEQHSLQTSATVSPIVGFDHLKEICEGCTLNLGPHWLICLHVGDSLLQEPDRICSISISRVNRLLMPFSV
jgi:hypothetical protein